MNTGVYRQTAAIAALLNLFNVAACDPGWHYRAPDGIVIAKKPGWFALAGPDSTALAISAWGFTDLLHIELSVTNTAATPLWLSPAAVMILDEHGEPVPPPPSANVLDSIVEVAAGATYEVHQAGQVPRPSPKGYRRLRVELPARRDGPAFQIAVRLAVAE